MKIFGKEIPQAVVEFLIVVLVGIICYVAETYLNIGWWIRLLFLYPVYRLSKIILFPTSKQ